MKSISDMNLAEVTLSILGAAVNIPDGMYSRAQYLAKEELRALLDKPTCLKCNDTGEADSGGVHPWGEGINTQCDCKQVSKRQINTIELQHMAVSEGGVLRWMTGRKMQDCELYAMPDGSAIRSKLYAEQPAPLAVVMPEHTMRSVMDAIQQARGFPMLTSNQCHALAESLNYVARLNGVKT